MNKVTMKGVYVNTMCFSKDTMDLIFRKAYDLEGKYCMKTVECQEPFYFENGDKGREFYEYVNTLPTLE